MRSPEDEQRTLDECVDAAVLVLDDIGTGSESVYARQVLQEILDRRLFGDRAGLVVTSVLSIPALSRRLGDAIASRLGEMCSVAEIRNSPPDTGGRPPTRAL